MYSPSCRLRRASAPQPYRPREFPRTSMSNLADSQSAMSESTGQEYLVFPPAAQEYGIDILKVRDIRGYDRQTVTRIANVPSFVEGVTNLRGVIVPVVVMRSKFGLETVEYSHHAVGVMLNRGSRVGGVGVD